MLPMGYTVSENVSMRTHCALSLLISFVFVMCSCTVYDVYPETNRNDCLTLSKVLNDSDQYFTSDSMLVFHEGEHILQGEVVSASNISNFTLQGYSGNGSGFSSPTITCVYSSLVFTNVTVAITFIDFHHCNISLSYAAVVVKDSRFENGTAVHGGALAVVNSVVLFDGANSFVGNSAERYGGAIYAEQSTLALFGTTVFTENKAYQGGAVYITRKNTFSLNGGIFMSNTAYIGGAVFAEESNTLSFSDECLFMSNTANNDGGAVYSRYENMLSFNGNSTFVSNTAGRAGGAVCIQYGVTLSFAGNSSFVSNSARYGGAVQADHYNTLSFNGNSGFNGNSARGAGGAIHIWGYNELSFSGNNWFRSNIALCGGAVYAMIENTLSFSGNNNFINDSTYQYGSAVTAWNNFASSFNGKGSFWTGRPGVYGGAIHAEYANTLSFSGNTNFLSNTAEFGGAVYAGNLNAFNFTGNSTFMSNLAYDGGAVYVEGNTWNFEGKSIFMNNMAEQYGGAVYSQRSTLSFHRNSIIKHNHAERGGGFSLFSNSLLHFSEMTSLSSNIAGFGGGAFVQESSITSTEKITVIGNQAEVHGGGLFVQSSDIILQEAGIFSENEVTNLKGGYGGAIAARNSIVEFRGSFNVSRNMAHFGGGLAFLGVSDSIFIVRYANVFFEGNVATSQGGAIYVEDDPMTFCTFDNAAHHRTREVCFFQTSGRYNCFLNFDPDLEYQTDSVTVKFYNNSANVSGEILHGGRLEFCVVCAPSGFASYNLGSQTFHHLAESETNIFTKMSSDPYKVCICEDGHPNCDLREVNRTLYPGQVLVTSVVAVGQMNAIVPSVIRAVSDDLIFTSEFQETQPAEKEGCSQLQYPLSSTGANANMKLYSDEPCSTSGYPLTFLINYLPCPVGFTLSEQGACVCDARLEKYTQNCNIQHLTISRGYGSSFWVGVQEKDELILHPHCPFDYCTDESATFPLNSTDLQCANGRSGILCGACQLEHSLALGSSRCLSNCSNGFIALLLAFAFAGVALVAFLFVCHLTVAEGTLSGLIFYANILAVNQTVFFPPGEQNLLTVFIAWLNLDLGIETCFFMNLNAYYRTWLQFVFPIYIWVMVGVIIVLADRSTSFARIIGSTNPVAVLATLFLLSYTKLLRAIMAAFSFTTLDYPDTDSKYVWLYDGNIGYLDQHDGRHIALFLFSFIFLLFIFLPYTFLLLCGQWIQKQLWWLSSTKQLYIKFFLDAHYGPYKNRHRYWTGLLLLLRFLVLFVSTITNINNPQDPLSNLLVVQVVASSLIAWGWFVRSFYKKWYHDLLEASFILNLIVLAGGTYQVRQSGGNQPALVYISVSIAFITFIGIVLSAVMQHMKRKLPDHLCTAIRNRFMRYNQNQNDENNSVPTAVPMATVTYSVVEIDHKRSSNAEHETKLTTSESTD